MFISGWQTIAVPALALAVLWIGLRGAYLLGKGQGVKLGAAMALRSMAGRAALAMAERPPSVRPPSALRQVRAMSATHGSRLRSGALRSDLQ
jgi:hypothetical protein